MRINSEITVNKNKEYPVNVIYTFDKKEQQGNDLIVNEWDLLNKENYLKKLIVGVLDKEEVLQLIKVSTCVYQLKRMNKKLYRYIFDDKSHNEGWYKKYRGKFYIQGGDFFTIYCYYGITNSMAGGTFGEKKVESKDIDGETYEMETLEYFPSPLSLFSSPIGENESVNQK